MYSLSKDYSETAHPLIMKALMDTTVNEADPSQPPQFDGYSVDNQHCRRAADIIRAHIGKTAEDCDVHFFVGGTQTNLTTITGALRPWESVISTHVGHIATLETGSIEAAGHKVCTTHAEDGKLTPALVEGVLKAHVGVHMVIPRMVYISNTTEVGTQYSKRELKELYAYCKEKNLLLFLDGARLGSALTSSINDLSMKDIANNTDAFYIGGTKNGAMFGEALVVSEPSLKPNFRQLIKQRGCLLAKGWLLGAQFAALFTDNLFYTAAEHSNVAAMILRAGVEECGYKFLSDSYSNQQYIFFPTKVVKRLQESFEVSVQRIVSEEEQLVRLCTSWATSIAQCHRLVELLKAVTLELGGELANTATTTTTTAKMTVTTTVEGGEGKKKEKKVKKSSSTSSSDDGEVSNKKKVTKKVSKKNVFVDAAKH